MLKSKTNENMENDRKINNLEYEVESYKRKMINLEARANEATEMT